VPTPAEFAAKWQGSTQSERAAAQERFIDLCRMLGQPTPHDADPTGEWYAFEKEAGKAEGGEGFADVWMRDHFAWAYKGKRKDLTATYSQLNGYREALGNPQLLVVCDLARLDACAQSGSSTPPAAAATSCTSRCSSSKTSNTRPSICVRLGYSQVANPATCAPKDRWAGGMFSTSCESCPTTPSAALLGETQAGVSNA
jgi:hypothetical protein